MTLGEKRKVVEALMCGTDYWGPNIEQMDCFDKQTIATAVLLRRKACKSQPAAYVDLELDTCEAAYRLIETSAVLRREWFGTP